MRRAAHISVRLFCPLSTHVTARPRCSDHQSSVGSSASDTWDVEKRGERAKKGKRGEENVCQHSLIEFNPSSSRNIKK